jgi:short-subunit dehydrogenase
MAKIVIAISIGVAIVALLAFSFGNWPHCSSLDVAGQRVAITGASQGIGKELALEYARGGASLILAARNVNKLNAVKAECESLGALRVDAVRADLAVVDDCKALIAHAVSVFDGYLDVLLLNHAVSDQSLVLEYDVDDVESLVAQFEKTMRINWLSFAVLTRLSMPALIAAGGHVSFVSSGSTYAAVPFHPAYISSKHAVNGFADSLGVELHSIGVTNVTLGTVVVGLIDTPMIHHGNDKSDLVAKAMAADACAQGIICTIAKRQQWSFVPSHLSYMLPLFRSFPLWLRTQLVHNSYLNLVPDFAKRIEQLR